MADISKVVIPNGAEYNLKDAYARNAIENLPTYESKQASQGGTDVSLVTTGEKYTWNNNQLPTVTSSDNGAFLRVVSGAWAVDTVPSANGVSF